MKFISSLLNKAAPPRSDHPARKLPDTASGNQEESPTTGHNTPYPGKEVSASLASASDAPAWTLLEGDFHLQTLNLNSVNAGLLEMIPAPPVKVLDVGCFCGGNGRWLKGKFPDCHLTGIELLEKAASIAAKDYEKIIVNRFEDVNFESEGLIHESFDAIITADVLEHLYSPWQALLRLKSLVSPSGALYASIPNVRNLRVIQPLAKGLWPYDRAGLKDVTHLRFFTHKEVVKMFAETGWEIISLEYHLDGDLLKLVEGKDLSKINSLVMDGLTLTDLTEDDVMEFMAVHFFVKAVPIRK